MKKLEIFPSHLEIREAGLPFGENFCAVKLSPKQAMAFTEVGIRNFADLLERYGANNQLHVGEFYNGYMAAFFWWGHTEVIAMRGQIQRIDPKTPVGCIDYVYERAIRKGLAWECVYPLKDGKLIQGSCKYVWNFRDCTFARHIAWGKDHDWPAYENLDADAIDKSLKDKLVIALQKEEKVVELTDEEDMVLKHYLGECSYYKNFFVEVE